MYQDSEGKIDSEVEKCLARHKTCMEAFADAVPLLRSSRLLSEDDRNALLKNVDEFKKAYEAHDASITVKLHQLFAHLITLLTKYGSVGLFGEDVIESLHAVVNSLGRTYSALDGRRRVIQVMRSLVAKGECLSKLHHLLSSLLSCCRVRKAEVIMPPNAIIRSVY